jgi:type IV pilus assembly protein PilC
MIFTYEAFNNSGDKLVGTIDADRKEDVAGMLYEQNLIVSKVVPVKSGGSLRVKPEELIIFTRLLATAINASVPLTRALEITMEELAPSSQLRIIILSVLHQLKTGKALSDSLYMYQNVFSELYVNMVRAGERSGKLGQALSEVLKYLQKRYELKKKISSAMLYPVFIFGFAILVLGFFVAVIIPQFKESYSSFGGEIPEFTAGLLATADWFKENFIFVGIGLAVTVYLLRLYIRSEKGRPVYEKFLFALPVAGSLYKMDLVSRFTRTLSVLLLNGITLVDALELVQGIVNNKTFEATIVDSIHNLTQGKSFTASLKQNPHIPTILVQMTAMGEESGRLAQLLDNLSDFYEKEVDVSVEKLTSVMTPILIAFIGVIIGIIVIGLFLPVFNLSQMVK